MYKSIVFYFTVNIVVVVVDTNEHIQFHWTTMLTFVLTALVQTKNKIMVNSRLLAEKMQINNHYQVLY